MFISQLKDKINAYDRYGEHRTNGLKSVYLLELMFIFNFFSSIHDPYFYYFFVPMTCFAAEIVGNTVKEKYLFLICSVAGSAISIFFFGVFSIYKIFFVMFVFGLSALLYYIVIKKLRNMLPVVPLILGLAGYSLIYGNMNDNFYVALNHALETLAALIVMVAGLLIFPKTYYLAIWRKAFCEVVFNLEMLTAKICEGEVKHVAIFSGIVVMERYSKMLPKEKKSYTILKITLLTFELVVSMSYLVTFEKQLRVGYMRVLHQYLIRLCEACKKREPIVITQQELAVFNETHELWVMYKLILSWNYLCKQ